MYVQDAIPARPAFIINDPQLAERIYKETDARAGGADHFGQRFLTDLRNDRLRLALLPKVGQQQQRPRQPLLARNRSRANCISMALLDPGRPIIGSFQLARLLQHLHQTLDRLGMDRDIPNTLATVFSSQLSNSFAAASIASTDPS
jgi:hypothetical protein